MSQGNLKSAVFPFTVSLVAALGSLNFGYGMGVMNTILEIISA